MLLDNDIDINLSSNSLINSINENENDNESNSFKKKIIWIWWINNKKLNNNIFNNYIDFYDKFNK